MTAPQIGPAPRAGSPAQRRMGWWVQQPLELTSCLPYLDYMAAPTAHPPVPRHQRTVASKLRGLLPSPVSVVCRPRPPAGALGGLAPRPLAAGVALAPRAPAGCRLLGPGPAKSSSSSSKPPPPPVVLAPRSCVLCACTHARAGGILKNGLRMQMQSFRLMLRPRSRKSPSETIMLSTHLSRGCCCRAAARARCCCRCRCCRSPRTALRPQL